MIEITSETPKVGFTVAGLSLSCFAPFSEGHVLERNEAETLNQTHRENIRNNTSKEIVAMLEANGCYDAAGELSSVSDEIIAQAQSLIDSTTKDYQFGLKTGGPRGPRDEARSMALAAIKHAILEGSRMKGKKASDWDKDELAKEMDRVLDANQPVLEHFRNLVAQKNSAAIQL